MEGTQAHGSLLEKAISIAARAHEGQVDKAGDPYVLHPLRLMLRMNGPSARIAAVLHDVIEDTRVTLQELRQEGFSEEVLTLLDRLTRKSGESYEHFIQRIKIDPVATQVKIADLEDNLDIRRLGTLADRDLERLKKYHRAWQELSHSVLGSAT